MRALCLFLILTVAAPLSAQTMRIPPHVRQWYRNPDGSCVQCSLGIAGIWANMPQASTLLWDTPYGPAERGGSWPERVSRYAIAREMPIYNVTGEPTFRWMEWATETGRGCGMAFGFAHFQTLYGHDGQKGEWYVCDNNSPERIDVYSDAEFRRIHRAAGLWCVILNTVPPPDPPAYYKWW